MGRQLPDTTAGTPTTSCERIRVTPVSGALGAEIGGVDLSRPLDEDTFGEVRRAFFEDLVIRFPDQSLTPEQHKAFGRRFRTLSIHPFAPHVAGHPEILETVAFRDNRCTRHYALNDYQGQRRVARRVTIGGHRPRPPAVRI